jgi:sodium/bile acid cotransporter 7
MAIKATLSKLPIDSYLLLLAGTVCLAWFFPVSSAYAGMAGRLVDVVVAVLFFFYGARLAPEAVVAGLGHWRLQAMVLASTYLLFPLIGVALYFALQGHIQADIATGLLFLCLLPSTVQSSVAFTAIARGNTAAAICSASFSNMIGVFVTPALVALLLPSAGGGFSIQALLDIGAQILLPFALGQLARRWLVEWLGRSKGFLTVIDRGSILLVVYTSFSAGMAAGIWSKVSLADVGMILSLDLAILALAMTATTLASRRLGFRVEDEIAIVFCGSKKSLAAGVPMAAVLFAGHAVSMIVLPLMLFHQAQLYICSVLARRYARRPAEALSDLPTPATRAA